MPLPSMYDQVKRRLPTVKTFPDLVEGLITEYEALETETTLHVAARRALFDALADVIHNWNGPETEDYLVAKMVLVQWVEPGDTRNRGGK